jgi:uncharacterized GH25 family protein
MKKPAVHNVAHSLALPRRSTAPNRRRSSALTVALVIVGSVSLFAHDMWIEPATFSPAGGQIVAVRLRIGQDLVGDPLPRDPALIKQFVIEDAEGRRPAVGRAGADPAGFVRVAAPGLALIGYHSNPSSVQLTAEKFDQYLKEEGLEAIAALRARRGQTGPVHEMFSRCSKSLLLSGKAIGTEGDRSLGFALELVAERNPYLMTAGQDLPVRLTYQGQPLPGALIVAINQARPAEKLRARSDKDGRVRFRLPLAGMWLIKAVHMIPAAAETHADWESFWASLTFDLPVADDASRTSTR